MELVNDEAAAILVEVEYHIVGGLVEVVIVDRLWLIHEYLLSIGVDLLQLHFLLG